MLDVRLGFLAACLFLLLVPLSAAGEDELYDEAGRVISSTDSEGVTSHFVYDEDGELVMTKRSDGTVILHDSESQPEGQ